MNLEDICKDVISVTTIFNIDLGHYIKKLKRNVMWKCGTYCPTSIR